jgi:hypothetical protein
MRRLWFVQVVVMVGVLLASPSANAEQLDARRDPRVSGPLSEVTQRCERKTEKSEGHIVLVARSCIRFYVFDPDKEADAKRDYGAIWLQTNVDSRRGWCATTVKSIIHIPPKAVSLVRRPRAVGGTVRRRYTTRLTLGANGKAAREAKIARSFVLYPRRLEGRLRREGRVFRAVWHGSRDNKLAFVSGVEISWRGDRPGTVSSSLHYRINHEGRSC